MDFNGKIDALEMNIINGKGIENVRRSLDDLKEIRETLKKQQKEKEQSYYEGYKLGRFDEQMKNLHEDEKLNPQNLTSGEYQKGDIVKVNIGEYDKKEKFVVIHEIEDDYFYDNRNGFYRFDEVELVCSYDKRQD